MRASRLFSRTSAFFALPLFACATFAACGGDDSSGGTTTDAGGTPDSSQADTGTHDTGPGVDAAHDSATDSATDASTDSPTTDGPTSDGNVADGGDGGEAGEAAAPTVVPCPGGTIPTATITVSSVTDAKTFTPTSVNIQVGQTVQWTWASGGHSVTSVPTATSCTPDGTFCSPNDTNCTSGTTSDIATTYCQQFNAAGTYDFVCVPHCGEGMRGSVVVQ